MRNSLYQTDVWTTANGDTLALTDMEPSHRSNLLAYLIRRADAIRWAEAMSLLSGPQPSGDGACDAFDAMFDELLEANPDEWVKSTPLVRELSRLVALDDAARPFNRPRVALHNVAYRARRLLPW